MISGFLKTFRQINPIKILLKTLKIAPFNSFVVPLHVPMAQDGVKELRRLAVDVLSMLGRSMRRLSMCCPTSNMGGGGEKWGTQNRW